MRPHFWLQTQAFHQFGGKLLLFHSLQSGSMQSTSGSVSRISAEATLGTFQILPASTVRQAAVMLVWVKVRMSSAMSPGNEGTADVASQQGAKRN